MNKQRIAIAAAAGIGVLGTFLPWYSMPLVGTVSGTAGDGWISLFLYAITIVFAMLGDRAKPLEGGKRLGAFIFAILGSLIGLFSLMNFYDVKGKSGDNPLEKALMESFKAEFGIFVVLLSGLVVVVLGLVVKDKGKS